jgi:ATP-dependent DNA helicase PIF1
VKAISLNSIHSSPEKSLTKVATSTLCTQELNAQQRSILAACRSGTNVFFSGGAGTGKSTLLLEIIKTLVTIHGNERVHATATTAVAAFAIGGTTVHQFAGIGTVLNEMYSAKEMDSLISKVFALRQMLSNSSNINVHLLLLFVCLLKVAFSTSNFPPD